MAQLAPKTPSVCWRLSRPAAQVWQLTLDNPPENRLPPAVLQELLGHLDTVEGEWRLQNTGKDKDKRVGGALVLASANDKFWSNGLVPATLQSPDFRNNVFDPLKERLLTFPLITIAAVKGHCFAGGMLLALCCDYRLVTSGRGLWSMNEVVIGVPIVGATAVLLRAKLTPIALRDAITGKRFAQKDLLRLGIVDEVVDDRRDPARLLDRAVELGRIEGDRAKGGSLGSIKDGVYADVLTSASQRRTAYYPDVEERAFWDRVAREELAASARDKDRAWDKAKL